MPNYNSLSIKAGKEKAIERKHPWIFSGALQGEQEKLQNGELIEVRDRRQQVLATGFYQRGTIAVKILSFGPLAGDWLEQKVEAAINFRRQAGVLNLTGTNCCRLIFAEGDGMPGLIVDKYDRTAVIQIHHLGWVPWLERLADALRAQAVVDHVFFKQNLKLGEEQPQQQWLRGHSTGNTALEYGHQFQIDWEGGQKTGFFLDQRENRRRLGELSKGKKVLNTFSYTGGFSIYALHGGARQVTSVDISAPAVALAHQNAEINGVAERHEAVTADVFEYLENKASDFDMIVLDPPAFSKSRRTTHNAMKGYKRLNRLAMEKIQPGGTIFTFSCSQHISPAFFEDSIRAAAIEAGREIRLLEKLGQPADHPVNIFHPEGEYLKGLILHVSR